jgi:hypothetical protein
MPVRVVEVPGVGHAAGAEGLRRRAAVAVERRGAMRLAAAAQALADGVEVGALDGSPILRRPVRLH